MSKKQIQAVERSITEKILIITGGPGVGKTAVVTRILKLYEQYSKVTLTAAPTGRAAIRLQELAGVYASTVHRLLECTGSFTFRKNRQNQLSCDLMVIDEFSMMDIHLTFALFQSLPSNTVLIIVGDPDQLPSVGPGNLLHVGPVSIFPFTNLIANEF